MHTHSPAILPANPALHFEGRFKTVKKKRVEYSQKITETDKTGMVGIGALFGLMGSVLGMASAHPAGVLAPTVGALVPAGSFFGDRFINRRRVYWDEVQVEMTEAEVLAVMTPLEKAQYKVEQGLKKWAEVRKVYQEKASRITGSYQTMKREHDVLAEEVRQRESRWEALKDAPAHEQAHGLKTGDPEAFHAALVQAQLQLKAKAAVLTQRDTLSQTAQQLVKSLDDAIQQQESKLYEIQEQLKLLGDQQEVVALYKQLQSVQTQQPNPMLADSEGRSLQMDLEKHKVEVEVLMQSIELASNVDNVLQSVGAEKY